MCGEMRPVLSRRLRRAAVAGSGRVGIAVGSNALDLGQHSPKGEVTSGLRDRPLRKPVAASSECCASGRGFLVCFLLRFSFRIARLLLFVSARHCLGLLGWLRRFLTPRLPHAASLRVAATFSSAAFPRGLGRQTSPSSP